MFTRTIQAGGGSSINISLDRAYRITEGTKTQEIDISKHYLIVASSESSVSNVRFHIYEIKNGVMSIIHEPSESSQIYLTASLLGNTITFVNTASQAYASYFMTLS